MDTESEYLLALFFIQGGLSQSLPCICEVVEELECKDKKVYQVYIDKEVCETYVPKTIQIETLQK